ncbi:MAG: N-6 DNA methylase, partial [Treponema sp.]|nr:N-6 DNA methylase [Treponema sp.]
MYEKKLARTLGFSPKDKTTDVYHKKYASGYTIEIDFENSAINYGKEIKSGSKTTQNFSQAENFVVLECVDRLLTKGYKAKDITLEKVFPSGHGHSGRLDIFIKNGKKAFLMIECKTFGDEFDKELAAIQKNGGQLFTYFQNDTNTGYLMLYASSLLNGKIEYKSEIIKIEDSYRAAGNVEDVYSRWNKITYNNGIFDKGIEPYQFQNKRLVLKDLRILAEYDSGFIFNSFASILRKHSVSDKPNAFNKIFNLFLAKLYDEGNCDTDKKRDTEALGFQWKEGVDDDVEFQVRLINLHKQGVLRFLEKEIEGLSDEELQAQQNPAQFKKKWLKFNKIFDIKDVNDDMSFDDNARVLKEVVQLLEKYRIRYPNRQQHLSDFFERLLTTGLKQEAGQYFTPVPITRFITHSLPVKEVIIKTVNQPNPDPKLPVAIDYAAGSGHFLTEMLEIYQDIINDLDTSEFFNDAQKGVNAWKANPYGWASKYIYGIEKDYRLVKVAKVGCYFYGDGLA